MQRRMQVRQKGLVELVHANEVYHVTKIVIAACCQFQLNKSRQIDEAHALDLLAYGCRIRESDRPWLPGAREMSGNDNVQRDSVDRILEAAWPARQAFVVLRHEKALKLIQAFGRQQ